MCPGVPIGGYHGVLWYGMVRYGMVRYGSVQPSAALAAWELGPTLPGAAQPAPYVPHWTLIHLYALIFFAWLPQKKFDIFLT